MKKFLIAGAALIAATAAGTVAASAAPQDYGYGRGADRGYERVAFTNRAQIDRQQANISQRIALGQRNGSLSMREASRLRGELRDIDRLEARYARYGFTRSEIVDLDRRLDGLSRQVFAERHDWNDRRGGRS